MADSTLSALPAAAALSGSELFYSVQSAADVKVTATQMKTFALAAPLAITGVANTSVLTSTGYSLTGANTTSMIDLAGSWNTSGAPTLIKANIAWTTSAVGSLLLDLQLSNVSKFKVDYAGAVTAVSTFFSTAGLEHGGQVFYYRSGTRKGVSSAEIASNGYVSLYSFRSPSGIILGTDDAAAPAAQNIFAQSVVAGTSNVAGADLNITGSLSTGSGIAGKIVFNLSQIVAAATAQNASSSVLSLNTIAASGIQFPRYGAGALSTDASGNITATSDERLKHIEGSFDAGLEELMGIDPILYKWTEASGMETEHTYAGLGAANVQGVIPEAVGLSGDGYLTLSDRALLATCINAIKQLATEMRS